MLEARVEALKSWRTLFRTYRTEFRCLVVLIKSAVMDIFFATHEYPMVQRVGSRTSPPRTRARALATRTRRSPSPPRTRARALATRTRRSPSPVRTVPRSRSARRRSPSPVRTAPRSRSTTRRSTPSRNTQNLSNHPDPISLEHFPRSRGIRLGGETYNARSLVRMIEQGGAWSRLVPHTRQPLTNAQINEIRRLAGVPETLYGAPRITNYMQHIIEDVGRKVARKAIMNVVTKVRRPPQIDIHADIQTYISYIEDEIFNDNSFPSQRRVPFAHGGDRPVDWLALGQASPAILRATWKHMDREYLDFVVNQIVSYVISYARNFASQP